MTRVHSSSNIISQIKLNEAFNGIKFLSAEWEIVAKGNEMSCSPDVLSTSALSDQMTLASSASTFMLALPMSSSFRWSFL